MQNSRVFLPVHSIDEPAGCIGLLVTIAPPLLAPGAGLSADWRTCRRAVLLCGLYFNTSAFVVSILQFRYV